MSRQSGLLRASMALLLVITAGLASFGLVRSEANAAPVTFRWDYAASGAAGFVLYCGPSSHNYPTRVDVGNTDTYTIGTLTEGAMSFCAVTAYDPAKVESIHSNEVGLFVPLAAPVVNFSASVTSGAAPLSVAFSNTTTGQVTTWAWNFGDGTTGNGQSATHVYSTPGSYTVVLTATGPGGTASKTAASAISVTAPAKPVVNFSASPSSGAAPLSVAFTNTTSGQVNTWAWNFGDGTTGTGQSPTHVYSTPGSYTVVLTATGPGGTASKTAATAISVSAPALPVVNFTPSPSSGVAPLTVAFANTSTGQVTTWAWNFGDGTTGTGQSPTHIYSTPGSYTVVLTATGPGGTASKTAGTAINVTTTGTPPPTGLVAAYAFNEGTGTTLADTSGNGNTGSISGATWTTQGRFGAALNFNGVDNMVQIPTSASMSVSAAMTLEAWIYPTASQSGWRTIVQRDVDQYFLYAGNPNGALLPAGGANFAGKVGWTNGPTASPLNAWTHVALTYDGTTLRLYVNGVQAASQARTGGISIIANKMSIGGNTTYGEYFQGRIDEVRVYNRALSQTQIQTDMNTSVAPVAPDKTPPSAPAGLTATAVGNAQVNLAWGASTDNVGVSGYRVERCQQMGCTSFVQMATPIGATFSNTGLSASTPYSYRVRATDAAGNLGAYSNVASVTTLSAPAPSGLVAAYSFNAGTGTTLADASGNGNTGTISGATWTTQGRFGAALSFNGVNNMVQIPSSASMNVSTAMTLEAWIYPTASQSGWRTIVQRDVDLYFLYASNPNGALLPAGGATFGGQASWINGPTASPLNAWTHLALTYDGATLRLYVNGVQAASQARTGGIPIVANKISIGGNTTSGEYFQGRIDEVRVYNRALSQTEIQTDMNTAAAP